MGLLKPAKNQTAFLKLGILGFEGSGKTYTAVEFAIGMALKGKKKVAWFDTEKGSDFFVEKFKKLGIQLDVVKSRSFKDLVATVKEAEEGGYDFLIIDSITHVWRDLVDSWLKLKKRNFLTMKDWGVLKTEWGTYTDLYVNSKLSIAMLGRAGNDYDMSEDEDGNQEIKKSGIKMKVETETGFEPDLLLEMFKAPRVSVTKNKSGKEISKKERGFVNKCVVLKDRTDTMNGKEIENPKFKDFASIMKFISSADGHFGVDTSRNSQEIFDNPDYSAVEKQRQKDIALEELQALLIKLDLSGTSKDAQKQRTELLEEVFTSSSKTFIENLHTYKIKEGIDAIKAKHGLEQATDSNQAEIEKNVKEAQEVF